MMKRSIILLVQLMLAHSMYSQITVGKRWDARFGGTALDEMYAIKRTNDGGYILGGTSYSGISGNKTQPNWDTTLASPDYWIVKTDANGRYQWDKRYGGLDDDYITTLCTTSDGGYLLGGFSGSDVGGDKTQPSQGGYDYWVVKLDLSGNKQWDKRFGGSGDEFLFSVKQTRDGGYILGGRSPSPISGDKTQPNWDSTLTSNDYWIVKIDSSGNKQWDKRFGSVQEDDERDIIQTPDDGYLLGGISQAYDTSGDKTQMDYAYNIANFWMVKTDSIGNKQWDKIYGGLYGEVFGNSLNISGGYLLGGTSYSAISGDKTEPNCGYWIVKIDTSGNKLGDWAYGTAITAGNGSCEQIFGSMSLTNDGGYLLTGISGSVIGNDKTENNLGGAQVWTIKVDSLMRRVWDKTALSTGYDDESAGVLQSSASCYTVGVATVAGIGGDKSQPNCDTIDPMFDYWMVEFCDTVLTGIQEPVGDMHLLVYPNPTTGDLTINISKDNLKEASYTLANAAGQVLYQATPDHLSQSYTKILDLSALPQGIYSIAVTVDGERIIKEIVKE